MSSQGTGGQVWNVFSEVSSEKGLGHRPSRADCLCMHYVAIEDSESIENRIPSKSEANNVPRE